jgi:hypothetical protein
MPTKDRFPLNPGSVKYGFYCILNQVFLRICMLAAIMEQRIKIPITITHSLLNT